MANSKAEDDYVEIPFTVEPNYDGWRLDLYLCEKIRRLSRTRVQEIISKDLICERKLKPSTPVRAGLHFKLRKKAQLEPETPKELPEIYRDEALIVFDKPAGLPMHPSARYYAGTVTSLITARYGKGFADPAHRLDRETSGLVVCARSTEISRTLMKFFSGREVEKEYLAIVEGSPPEDSFEMDAPIAEGGAQIRIAVRIDPVLGKPSRTHFQVESRFLRQGQPFALVRARPHTGRQHQIRVHLREAGFPIVGDKIYGPDESYFDRFSRNCLEDEAWQRLMLPRHALHAVKITLPHPVTGEPLSIEAPLPQDMKQFMSSQI